ncbi:hypothetical protein H7J93_09680 [Mycobacterium barrassiae]|uniref:hypothetical protein n=1 Tax=Mycobacterium barrassiae TaxID=319709 RepID=UPI002265BEE9|nr:hypothetical protein [Mycobacterium barrassiae]MCV7299904.1 hypothetical protein [Mycobacterium barrassiae]
MATSMPELAAIASGLAADQAQNVDQSVDRHGRVNRAKKATAWNTGCNSWYLTDEGNVDL